MGIPSGMELLVILAIVVLLFGAKKIPDLAKGIGKGIKDFKKEMKDDEEVVNNKQINQDINNVNMQQTAQTTQTTEEVKSAETTKQQQA